MTTPGIIATTVAVDPLDDNDMEDEMILTMNMATTMTT
jgi:hypothetical protein